MRFTILVLFLYSFNDRIGMVQGETLPGVRVVSVRSGR
jgi:hypothetical protein